MPRKFIWMVLGCLLVMTLVLTSCGPAEVEEEEVAPVEEEEEEEVAPVEEEEAAPVEEGPVMVRDALGILKEKPQYGGVGRYCWTGIGLVGCWDPAAPISGRTWHLGMYSTLTRMDFTRGPSGTGEYKFTGEMLPESIRIGLLAESFEQIDLQTVVYRLRKGIHYHNKPPANGREMVAEDFVYCINRIQNHPRSPLYKPPGTPEEDFFRPTALDKYTLEIKLPTPNSRGFTETNFSVYPPEMIDEYGDLEDWRNACGTGPWICTDFVPDSTLTYMKNQDYFDYDPFFPENKVPYADSWMDICVPDMNAALAALRTGKIDWMTGIGWEDAEILIETHPHLGYSKALNYYNPLLAMRNDLEPFDDIRFRKALAIAIDRKTIARDLYKGNSEWHVWPYDPSLTDLYIPYEELPLECQELYDYDPEKAKQLLAEAGYPNGYKIEILVSTGGTHIDLAQIVKTYWDAIGVETTVKPLEVGTFLSRMYGWRYDQTGIIHWPSKNPYSIYSWCYNKGKMYNYGKVDDPYVIEVDETLKRTIDPVERTRILKEAGLRVLAQCYDICLPATYTYVFWQPWLKGYNGEWAYGTTYRWHDGALRKQMVGQE